MPNTLFIPAQPIAQPDCPQAGSRLAQTLAMMFTLDDLLNTWIPYRLEAIETLCWAWNLSESDNPSTLKVLVNGDCCLEGNIAAIANPMIEAGFIHARALLEFLGLAATKNGKLSVVTGRRPGDLAIENFSTSSIILKKATPESVVASYSGPKEEAEKSLVAIFEMSNRWLAHITDGSLSQTWTDQHIEIALQGIPVLIYNHLYAPLGLKLPNSYSKSLTHHSSGTPNGAP